MKLLLADDEEELSRALCAILKHAGYTVDAVDNGKDALEYARVGAYDGMILDIIGGGRILHRENCPAGVCRWTGPAVSCVARDMSLSGSPHGNFR